MQEEIEKSWVPFPRKIANDYRNRIITRDEYFVYSWLRLNANSFGVSTTSLSDLSNDLLRKKNKENYINKLLLSLKEKRYIYYPKRTGCRGSFNVNLGYFYLKNGTISSLDKFFDSTEVRSESTSNKQEQSEIEQNLPTNSQNLNIIKSEINSLANVLSINDQVRTYNNDNNKENKITIPFNKLTKLSEFIPKTPEGEFCLTIAEKLGEEHINGMYSLVKEYGIDSVKKAWVKFQRDEPNATIKKRGAYFTFLVKKFYQDEN